MSLTKVVDNMGSEHIYEYKSRYPVKRSEWNFAKQEGARLNKRLLGFFYVIFFRECYRVLHRYIVERWQEQSYVIISCFVILQIS